MAVLATAERRTKVRRRDEGGILSFDQVVPGRSKSRFIEPSKLEEGEESRDTRVRKPKAALYSEHELGGCGWVDNVYIL